MLFIYHTSRNKRESTAVFFIVYETVLREE